MVGTLLVCLTALIFSSLVQCQSVTHSSTISTVVNTPHYHKQYHQTRHHPSLRNLIFPGFYMLSKPSLREAQLHHAIDMKPFAEIDTNELPPAEMTKSSLPLAPPPIPSVANIARFTALRDQLALDKAIMPTAMPVLHEVASDQVVKKITYTSPRMMDTIPDLVME